MILLVLMALFLSSGGLRLILGLNEAWAVVQSDAANSPAPKPAAETCPPAGPADGKFLPLVEALKAREARVAEQETALSDRSKALSRAKQDVEAKLAELKAADDRLSERLTLARGAAEGDVAKLTAMYAEMKPKMASAIFEKMAPDFAAGFLARMQPQAAALILAGLTPEKAYTVSVMLAGRNAAAPKN
ncbi:MAG: hypothetical protein KGK00_17185 [Paracoccaceae bacterium]|nr:hypothetical protein [Paracoccaceae bacterium]